jgi:hypothetical protein
MMLLPDVTCVFHPIDPDKHPDAPPGWRWAVQLGGTRPSNIEFTANAGWAPDRESALATGDTCAATVVVALKTFGIQARLRYLELDSDPVPVGEERVRVLGEEG